MTSSKRLGGVRSRAAHIGTRQFPVRGRIAIVMSSLPVRSASLQGASDVRRILRDVQFWIPVIVLIGGLAVLQWIR
jgi:hypothetical protein